MHIAAVTEICNSLVPALTELRDALAEKAKTFDKIIKIGRTHLQVLIPNFQISILCLESALGRHTSDPWSRIQWIRAANYQWYRSCQWCSSKTSLSRTRRNSRWNGINHLNFICL